MARGARKTRRRRVAGSIGPNPRWLWLRSRVLFLAVVACWTDLRPEPLGDPSTPLDEALRAEFSRHKRSEDTTLVSWDDPQQVHYFSCTLERVDVGSAGTATVDGRWRDELWLAGRAYGAAEPHFTLHLTRDGDAWVCDNASSERGEDTYLYVSGGKPSPCVDFARVCLGGTATHQGWRIKYDHPTPVR